MLTKKDYIAIARILADARVRCYDPMPINNIMGGLADYFQQDNPNFDRERFKNACMEVRNEE